MVSKLSRAGMARKENTITIAASAAVGVVAILALSIIWSAFWFGLALSLLWGWFVVPLFGAAQIGTVQAYGLILTLKALQAKIPNKDIKEASFGDRIARTMMLPPFIAGIFIGVGWVVSIWV